MGSANGSSDPNRELFDSDEVVARYALSSGLQPAEKTIIGRLRDVLMDSEVLDIGVGAGRTMLELAPLCRRYVGVDYSPKMVETCRRRLPPAFRNVELAVADARNLAAFVDGSFGVVIFSFNGLDCMGLEDRATTLGEIRRVLRSGGWFVFSTHNMGWARDVMAFRPGKTFVATLRRFKRMIRLWLHNPHWILARRRAWTFLRDGALEYRCALHFVAPSAQARALHAAGFGNVQVFGAVNGSELSVEQADRSTDSWLYYVCRAGGTSEPCV